MTAVPVKPFSLANHARRPQFMIKLEAEFGWDLDLDHSFTSEEPFTTVADQRRLMPQLAEALRAKIKERHYTGSVEQGTAYQLIDVEIDPPKVVSQQEGKASTRLGLRYYNLGLQLDKMKLREEFARVLKEGYGWYDLGSFTDSKKVPATAWANLRVPILDLFPPMKKRMTMKPIPPDS